VEAIPEPGSASIIGLAAALFAGRRMTKRRAEERKQSHFKPRMNAN